jgi:GntR family transcriptional regulator of vanillate catabolism
MVRRANTESRVAVSQVSHAVDGIRRLILTGELSAGDRVLEVHLAEHLGMSRMPVRFALAELTRDGLLEKLGTVGFAIRGFSLREVSDTITLRAALEGSAARLAAQRRDQPRCLLNLLDCADELDALVSDAIPFNEATLETFGRLNDFFHRELLIIAQSDVLLDAYDRVLALPFAEPSGPLKCLIGHPECRANLILAQTEHRIIIAAVASGRDKEAERLVRKHSELARRDLARSSEHLDDLARLPGRSMISIDV